MVYVDKLRTVKQSKAWPWKTSAYLYADTEEELHKFAGKMHMPKSWCHMSKIVHYDLTESRRLEAVMMYGAVERPILDWWREKKRENGIARKSEKSENRT